MRQTFNLDARALLRARASKVLALDPSALGSTMALAASSPSVSEPGPGVALVSIEGPLQQRASDYLCGMTDGYDAIAERFTAALADRDVGAVVLRIDSPGGDLNGLEEGVRRMAAAKETAGKPVLVYVDELAASAAYWIAAALGDEIVLPVAGAVGSIGVIAWYVDETAALASEGLALHVHRDPPGKAAMHPGSPVTAVADAELQRVVAESSQRFASAISATRKVSLASIGGLNGEVVYGEAAIRAGLADRIGTLEGTIEAAATAAQERQDSMARDTEEKKAMARIAFRLDGASRKWTAEEMTDAELLELAVDHIDKLGPLAELGAGVLKLAGGTPVEALAAAGAWKESHDRAEQERAELAKQRAAAENKERLSLLAELVKAGYETPATAWADPVGAPGKEPHPDHAGTPIESLRRRKETLCATPRAAVAPPRVPAQSATHPRLTEAQLAKCRANDWDPDKYAERLHATRGRAAANQASEEN